MMIKCITRLTRELRIDIGLPEEKKKNGAITRQGRRSSLRAVIPVFTLLVACIGAPRTAVLAQDGVAAAVQQAEKELEQLDMQEPESFLQLFDFMLEEGSFDRALIERAKKRVQEYIRARTEVIQSMLVSFINTDADYDYTDELEKLARLEQAFQADMADIGETIPELGTIHEMLSDTSLRLPSFVRQVDAENASSDADR